VFYRVFAIYIRPYILTAFLYTCTFFNQIYFCYRLLEDFFYPDLHFMHEEFENSRAPWNNTVPDYFGFGYVILELEVGLAHSACVFIVYFVCLLFI